MRDHLWRAARVIAAANDEDLLRLHGPGDETDRIDGAEDAGAASPARDAAERGGRRATGQPVPDGA